MLKNTTQKGFSVLEALLITLLIAALAFGGWYFWQKNRKPDKNNSNQNTSQSNQSGNTHQNNPDPSEGGKYLVIKEWNVRFLLPEELRGQVRYVLSAPIENRQTAWFEVAKIAELPGSECKLPSSISGTAETSYGIGTYLIRSASKMADGDSPIHYLKNKNIGDFWFVGGNYKGSEACAGNPDNYQIVGDTAGELTFSLKELEAL